MDQDEDFEERTVVSGGLKSEADYLTCKALLAAGKLDEALFKFRVNKTQLDAQLEEWIDRLTKI